MTAAPEPRAATATGRPPLLLALLTFALMLPVTLPVPVLRPLVVERYGVSDSAATLFMSANMLGALLAAPLTGLLADRFGRRRRAAVGALLLDALLMLLMALADTYPLLLLLRTAEGAAHISALSLVLALGHEAAGSRGGRALGMLGAGLTLGVATGAALGGLIGRGHPAATLELASGCLGVAALLARCCLPADGPARDRPGIGAIAAAVARERGLLLPLWLAFVERFTVGFFTTGFPLLLAGVHGVERWRIGALLAAFLYPFALLSYPCGKLAERRSPVLLCAVGSLLYGLGTLLVGVVPPAWLWLLMPVLGIASAVMFVPSLVLTIAAAPAVGRSTAVAAFNAAGSLGFLLGPLVCGALVALREQPADGHALAFAVAGASEILCAVMLVPRLRSGAWR